MIRLVGAYSALSEALHALVMAFLKEVGAEPDDVVTNPDGAVRSMFTQRVVGVNYIPENYGAKAALVFQADYPEHIAFGLRDALLEKDFEASVETEGPIFMVICTDEDDAKVAFRFMPMPT